ncbi:MAG: glycoside hydrolase family 30 protein [Ginsengibacter sp.]
MNYYKYYFLLLQAFLSIAVIQQVAAQKKKVAGDGPVATVYVSSRAGDRLTRKADAGFTPQATPEASAIVVDEKTSFQRIEGFGATFNEGGMICLNTLDAKERNEVFRDLFDSVHGAGFTLMKSPIAACDFASAGPWYTYDDTKDDTLMNQFSIKRDLEPNGLITFIRKAKEFGKFEIESPMDFAPDWMYYSLDSTKKHIQPKYYSALARYYMKYLTSYASNGVTINYLNLFNEADNTWYSNVTYKVIGELIKNYVGPALQAGGLSTKIQFGETSNRPEAMEKFPACLADNDVKKWVNSLTVHGYDWNKFSTLTDLHNKYPDLPIWQTEVCYAKDDLIPPGGPSKLPVYDFDDGEFWGNMIAGDMKNWVSAWIYWNMVLDQKGGPWLIAVEHGNPDNNYQHPVVIIDNVTKKVSYTGLYYYLAHFSRFVRPGAYRINCTGGSKTLNYVGFKNQDGSVILNVINNSTARDCSIVRNKQVITQTLPAHSITTFRWTSY